jgi:hypothetical protein
MSVKEMLRGADAAIARFRGFSAEKVNCAAQYKIAAQFLPKAHDWGHRGIKFT